jgi:excisionase family DNA binding protein
MVKSPDMGDLITVTQAAAHRNVTRQAILFLIQKGELSAVEVAGRYFISQRELDAYSPNKGGRPPKPKNEKASKGRKKENIKK